LYQKLATIIVPMFYEQPDRYAEVMRSTIAINGSFFNTQRMILQYLSNAYFPADAATSATNNHIDARPVTTRSAL
jgi:starch phosphorylase